MSCCFAGLPAELEAGARDRAAQLGALGKAAGAAAAEVDGSEHSELWRRQRKHMFVLSNAGAGLPCQVTGPSTELAEAKAASSIGFMHVILFLVQSRWQRVLNVQPQISANFVCTQTQSECEPQVKHGLDERFGDS